MGSPFLKWAGGKGKVAPRIAAMLPEGLGRYHEPFLGGGAVFFAASARLGALPATLNDLNQELINAYRVVQSSPGALTARLEEMASRYLPLDHRGRGSEFYRVRQSCPQDRIESAARLIFLNKTCFNGLYRVNRRGEFNVPHGQYVNPRIADVDAINAASLALQQANLTTTDFEEAMSQAAPGDFVYLDPPYQPLSRTASFTSYTSVDFGWAEQIRLRDAFERLTQRGVAAVLSNASHPDIASLYSGFGYTLTDVAMARAINSDGARRAPIPELLVTNFARRGVAYAAVARPK